jgi:hypothetical protein
MDSDKKLARNPSFSTEKSHVPNAIRPFVHDAPPDPRLLLSDSSDGVRRGGADAV